MTLYIDADGCPVVNEAILLSGRHNVPCVLLCDTAHVFERPGARTIMVSKGSDSVDFALVNLVQPGDIVVTQDYGLAAMCLARRAIPLHQDGMVYTTDNIDGLLMQRHTARKIRQAGGRTRGPKKRTAEQDAAFKATLERILSTANE